MQSLVLITSLILSGPDTTIATFDSAEDLKSVIDIQVNRVNNIVLARAAVDAQDTFLYQAKYAIRIAKADAEIGVTYELAAK
ncbi:hypothetical protein [uncultured Psychrosphaera sp.]|uniref:hypothetical protein n=1 Tax=uncultured Psychrosphaera sp. TaxID=1403522 RepID=UPI0026143D46|nr:hypothetical protein [uncultured Psychrosphaera sp.]